MQRAPRQSFQPLPRRAETSCLPATASMERSRLLKRECVRRKVGEDAARRSKAQYDRLLVQSLLMQQRLRGLTRQILVTHEVERRKISRELHDQVVQTLVGISIQLSTLGQGASLANPELSAGIAHTQRLVIKTMNAVYHLARELRPSILDDLGLIPALRALVKTVTAGTKLKIHLTVFAGVENLDNAKRTVFYRVAQEALSDVTRRAYASLVKVNIRKIPGAICLEVRDTGKPLQLSTTRTTKTNQRLVVVGMRERVEMVGGTLTIESVPGQGRTVRADEPRCSATGPLPPMDAIDRRTRTWRVAHGHGPDGIVAEIDSGRGAGQPAQANWNLRFRYAPGSRSVSDTVPGVNLSGDDQIPAATLTPPSERIS